MPPQLSGTNGPPRRRLARWTACAKSSFPVPDSPRMRSGSSRSAKRSASTIAARIAGLSPITSPNPNDARPAARGGDDDARRPEPGCGLGREARPVGLVVLKQEEPSSDVVLREPLLDHQRATRHQLERARMRDLIVAVDAERPALLAPMVN